MVACGLPRRHILTASACAILAPGALIADSVIDLEWSDLVPLGQTPSTEAFSSLFGHDETGPAASQPVSTGVRADWNGQTVGLAGFIVPIEFDGAGVTTFILAPFVGACVHVPPPPANQLVLVSTDKPYQITGAFEAVHVIGTFGAATMRTDLAEIGYTLSADRIEPFN